MAKSSDSRRKVNVDLGLLLSLLVLHVALVLGLTGFSPLAVIALVILGVLIALGDRAEEILVFVRELRRWIRRD